jgi:uncharacterized membrane protein
VCATHGAALAVGGACIMWLFRHHFWLLAGALSGFLVVAPVLAVGLYALSRAHAQGRAVRGNREGFLLVWRTWMSWRRHAHASAPGSALAPPTRTQLHHDWRLVRFGLLLALAGTGWVLTSAGLITWLAPAPIERPEDFLRHVVLARTGWLFEAWVMLGALLAAPVFASSVITLPLLLDRRIALLPAVLTSWRVVLDNPGVMALWAIVLATLIAVGFATALVGLVWIVPWLGAASWHAYVDCVDASAWPEREAQTRGR